MSYFMVTKGKMPDFSGIDKVEAFPINQAQLYLSRLAEDLSEDANISNLYFIHDGESGTSDNFITEAEGQFFRTGSIVDTDFHKVIDACAEAGNSFRIWWAGSPKAHLEIKWFDSIELLKEEIAYRMQNYPPGRGIGVGYKPHHRDD